MRHSISPFVYIVCANIILSCHYHDISITLCRHVGNYPWHKSVKMYIPLFFGKVCELHHFAVCDRGKFKLHAKIADNGCEVCLSASTAFEFVCILTLCKGFTCLGYGIFSRELQNWFV